MTAKALTVVPGVAGSARLDEVSSEGGLTEDLTVETLLVGVCGTDGDILAGHYGEAPDGRRLVLGHEAVGRVTDASSDSGFATGQLVVPIVRRPDPVPCSSCAVGEWDMCQNGRYTESGIKGADGFARTTFALEAAFAVPVPTALGDLAVLVEPASVVAKAWEHIERIGARAHWEPTTVLVTGAGPIGLLAALMARVRGYDTHVLDQVTVGPKPDLVAEIGATYHTGVLADACVPPDIVIECTGAAPVVLDAIEHTARTGIVCLAGISSGSRTVELDAAGLNRRLVLENDVVFGTVNANRRHYLAAVDALQRTDPGWLERIVSRRVPLDRWEEAFDRQRTDVKVVLDVSS